MSSRSSARKNTTCRGKTWRRQGWIATANCHEVRIPLAEAQRMEYALAEQRYKYPLAAQNPRKFAIVDALLQKHAGARTLIIGMYLEQLEALAKHLQLPLITGKTPVTASARCCTTSSAPARSRT